jgi:uncharacterized protein (TIRG00374 family)
VLASLGARLRFRVAAEVKLSTFLVSHVTPFGSAANIASAIPITPGGLGVIEVTLVAITVGFGAPRATAVIAVLGYRVVNYWLPLLPGALAYLRLRLSLNAEDKAQASRPPAR